MKEVEIPWKIKTISTSSSGILKTVYHIGSYWEAFGKRKL